MNTTFDTMDEAYPAIEVALRDQAAQASENGGMGADTYRQAFDVGGTPYTGILAITYDRTSRAYSFIVGMDYRVEDASGNAMAAPEPKPAKIVEKP